MSTILVNLDQLVDSSVVANASVQTAVDARDEAIAIKDEIVVLDSNITTTANANLAAMDVKALDKMAELDSAKDANIVELTTKTNSSKVEINDFASTKEQELQAVADEASREVAKLDNIDVITATLDNSKNATGVYEYDELSNTSILKFGIPRGSIGLTPQIELTVDEDGNIYSTVVGATESVELAEWSTGEAVLG